MYRLITILLFALLFFGSHAHADPFPDCELVWINGHYECENPKPLFSSQQLAKLVIVVVAPILLNVLFRGVWKEQRISDDEWQKLYPGRDLWTRDKKPLGIGFYLGSAYMVVGVAFFWLMFVAPEALKWLIGQ